MKVRLVALAAVVAFALGTAGIGMAASKVKCEVKSVDGNTVVLDCKDAGNLKAGTAVEVSKKRKAIEGC